MKFQIHPLPKSNGKRNKSGCYICILLKKEPIGIQRAKAVVKNIFLEGKKVNK